MSKSNIGNFLEDFRPGQTIRHATPRTITEGDVSNYISLTGSRYALFCAESFANTCGFRQTPVDPLLVFHIVFGKSVPDISLNAVANLGYAEGRILTPVFAGDTLFSISDVLGVKENSNRKTGVVHVRTRGENRHGETVIEYVRWVMVNKRDPASSIEEFSPPAISESVRPDQLVTRAHAFRNYDCALAGSPFLFEDYRVGERIDHVDGMTVEEAEHQLATRLYQNTAKVHFDGVAQAASRFGKRLIYGGVAISIARALAFNGLANAAWMLAINAGRHVNPLFAGDTVYAWSEVLDAVDLGAFGALRLRLIATKNTPCGDYPLRTAGGSEYDPAVILDFDYWAAIPKRG
jgi:2-methylfumaryl-CoA hydratase